MSVLTESWRDFELRFGGLGGPGLLPNAVHTFFENGGRRALVIRIVHEYGGPDNDTARSSGALEGLTGTGGGPPTVWASDEGSWGNGLAVDGVFRFRNVNAEVAAHDRLVLGVGQRLDAGALLRINSGSTSTTRWVNTIETEAVGGTKMSAALLHTPLPALAPVSSIEEVTVDLNVRLISEGIVENHQELGLDPAHPRYVPDALAAESLIVRMEASVGRLTPDSLDVAAAVAVGEFTSGIDRTAEITHDDLFDATWIPGDEPGSGVHAIADDEDIGTICIPDLYAPFTHVEDASVVETSVAGGSFDVCVDIAPLVQDERSDDLAGIRLDPNLDFDRIVELQQQLVGLVEQLQCPVALLDVPPGLTDSRIRDWRGRFNSSYAAAYHPWLRVPVDDRLETVNPSAAAAGIIARRELRDGIPTGPANELAEGAAAATQTVDPVRNGEFHHLGINVLIKDRNGVKLTAARTLSADRQLRQLSVRRLMVMIRKSLAAQMQWITFEPNHRLLRSEVRHLVRSSLRDLYRRGAFRGASESAAFFVRCDDSNNPPPVGDAGRLVVEIGVAPAHPMEFLEVTIAVDSDATVRTEESRG